MSNYSVSASPFFYDVTCPKHRNRLQEIDNGLLGEKTWYCEQCDKPYQLKPIALRAGTYDREYLEEQINQTKEKK